jgi:hypothetical protein
MTRVVAILESEPVSVDPNDELNSIFDLVGDYDRYGVWPRKETFRDTDCVLDSLMLLRDQK